MTARFGMGYVIPRLVLLAFVADAALRLLPIDSLTFRAWEALKRHRPPGAAFERSRRYFNPRAYGDLAALGNLYLMRQYRPETFSTDALGFRNPELAQTHPPVAIVVGDSFTVGSGVNDDETLPMKLSRSVEAPNLGHRFYNAGGVDVDSDRILDLARRLRMDGGLVIHEYHEHYDPPAVPTPDERRYRSLLASVSPGMGDAVGRLRGLITVSPLKIVCERAIKRLHGGDSWLLPNPHASHVVEATLTNGDPMLFLAEDVALASARRPTPTEYWTWLKHELRLRGFELVVVLVPSKYTVYRPLLREPPVLPPSSEGYLHRLESALRQAGLPALDLTGTLQGAAKARLSRREYVYWLDDLHWTPEGTALAAEAVHEWLTKRAEPRPAVTLISDSGAP